MVSVPSVMSSSPAIIRNAVDLPQPDGPTNTRNSPSAMSRSRSATTRCPSAKALLTCEKRIAAMSMDALGEALHEIAIEQDHHQHDRQRREMRQRPERS